MTAFGPSRKRFRSDDVLPVFFCFVHDHVSVPAIAVGPEFTHRQVGESHGLRSLERAGIRFPEEFESGIMDFISGRGEAFFQE